MNDRIISTKDGAVATIRLNRPEKKNALTGAMYAALSQSIVDAVRDDDVRAIALLGGEDFTAGNDIADFVASGGMGDDPPPVRFLRALGECPKPVIAGVRGAAIGIGTTMLMHCDAVVLGTSAKMAMPFTKLGLVPEGGSSVLLPLISGRLRAWWLLLSSETFGADEAMRLGLATRVVDDAQTDATALAMCEQLAKLPPKSIANTKRMLKEPFAQLVRATMDEEFRAFSDALRGDEARAALMSFLQR
ncbi:MAG: enoyl-CoA hydratase-related protein [Vulcanimicrobiaceae bacterium]